MNVPEFSQVIKDLCRAQAALTAAACFVHLPLGKAQVSDQHCQVTRFLPCPTASELQHQEGAGPLFRCPLQLACVFGSQTGLGNATVRCSQWPPGPWQSSGTELDFQIQGFMSGEAELSGMLFSKLAIKMTLPAVIFLVFILVLVPKS